MKKPWGILQEIYGAKLHLIPRRWVILPKKPRPATPLLRARIKGSSQADGQRSFHRPAEGLFELPQARGFVEPLSSTSAKDASPAKPESAPKKNFPKI